MERMTTDQSQTPRCYLLRHLEKVGIIVENI